MFRRSIRLCLWLSWQKLVNITPGNLDKVFFTASGTEADETAVALAQTHAQSTELVALRHGYSGRSMLAQSLTAHHTYRGVQTQIPGIKHAAPPYCYRCPYKQKPESCELECAQDIEALIQTTTTGHIAGMLAEPIMGVGASSCLTGLPQAGAEIIRKYGGSLQTKCKLDLGAPAKNGGASSSLALNRTS